MNLQELPTYDEEGRLLAVIECPQGTRQKTRYVPRLEAMVLGHTLPAGTQFPFEFGFIPSTRSGDGDPLDVLVMADEPTFPGCVVAIRLLGVIEAEQQEDGQPWVRNDRLVGIALVARPIGELDDLRSLGQQRLDEIANLFTADNHAQGKGFRVLGIKGLADAEAVLKEALKRKKKD